MNRTFYFRGFLCLWLCSLAFACKPAAEHQDEKSPAATEATNAEGGLKIDVETQKRMGLKVETVMESEFTPETKCFGHVVDPSPLNAALNEITLAKATVALSQKEYDRLKVLREQNNASDRAFQAAEAALQRDRITERAATEKLHFAWGKEIGGRKDLAEMAQALAEGNRSLVRIDLAIEEKPAKIHERLRISPVTSKEAFDAVFIGHAPVVDLPTQGHGLFFLVSVGNDKLPINSSVFAQLQGSAAALKGFTIPASAVVRHDGERWFYLGVGENEFHREPLVNPLSSDSGYFVTNGVEAGANIVITAAQQLLSEELKSQIKAD